MIAASLKRFRFLAASFQCWKFPRSDDRGLIEACCRVTGQHGPQHFRDQMIAASLKPYITVTSTPALMLFPRSDDRGLIEARLHDLLHALPVYHFRDQMIAASLKHLPASW